MSALSALIARQVQAEFEAERAAIFYSAGGHFLLHFAPCAEWRDRLASLRSRLDAWLLQEFQGEVVFHLAASAFHDGK